MARLAGGLPAAEEVAAGDHRGDRQPAAQRLAAAEDVRPHPLVLDGEEGRPVRPKPVKISSAISSVPCLRQISASPASQPAGGISTPSRPTIGSTIAAPMSPLARTSCTRARSPPKGSRRTCAVEMGGEGGAELLPRGDVERPERRAVVGGLEGEDARPAGGAEGGLQGDLDRLGAGDREEDLRLVDRRDLHQPPRELDAQRMGHDVPEGVEEPAGLLAHRLHHPRMAMADRGDAEARGEVYIEVAVDVADVGAPRLLPEDRGLTAGERVDPGSLEPSEGGRQLARARPGGRDDDLGGEVAEGHISRRPASERPSVTSSVYSMSPPTGMPKARRVTRTPRGLSSRAR